MNPRVMKVKTLSDYRLQITFEGGEERLFDVKPYLGHGIFKALKDPKAFSSAAVSFGSVEWAGGQDLCPDTLYEESKPIKVLSIAAIKERRTPYCTVSIPKKKKFAPTRKLNRKAISKT